MKPAERLALAISRIGHPLVFVMISVAVVAVQIAPARAVTILSTLFLAVIAPTAVLLIAGVRTGRWQDADVSVRAERKRFYPWAILIAAFGTAVTWATGAPLFIVRGALVTLALFMAAALVNARLKISLHTLFAAYCTIILTRISWGYGIAALVLAGFVFWSRIFLGRHNLAEACAGLALGALGGLFAVYWPT